MADQKTETQAAKAEETPKAEPVKAAMPKAETAKPAPAVVKAAEPAKPAAPAKAPAAAAKKAAPAKAAAKRKLRTVAPVRKTVTRKTITTSKTNVKEGTTMMKNETKQAADRFQAMFGDANERAKTAFERNTRFAEELTELTKGNVEAFVASTKVAAKGVETLGQEVAELSRKSFEEASTALKGFAEVKSAADFFRLQGDYARGQFDALVAESAKMSEALIKLAGDVAEPLTSRYSVAAERVKAAVAL